MRHRIGQDGRASVLFVMAPVDPGRGNAHSVGRHMVVEQTLGDVEQLILGNSRVTGARQEIFEVPEIRLVGANFLRSQDLVELDPKPPVTFFRAGGRSTQETVVRRSPREIVVLRKRSLAGGASVAEVFGSPAEEGGV